MTGRLRHRLRLGFAGMLTCCGCQFGGPAPFEADPLFGPRAPVGTVLVPLQEPLFPSPPSPPILPAGAVELGPEFAEPTPVEVMPSEELPPPMPIPPEPKMPRAVRLPEIVEADPPEEEAEGTTIPVSAPVSAEERFGHDPNYRWLRGVVDRHYRGHVSLRYRDATESDRWGGKVHLLGEVSDEYQSGDVIHVQGEMRPDETPPGVEGDAIYPGYRIDRIRKVVMPQD